MGRFDNPVLHRELLVNLRTFRSFMLLALYQLALSAVVYFAWPKEPWLDLTENPDSTRNLVDLFFLGNFVIASLMTPSFAAGVITGEKERKTFELLLASPLHPQSIVWGKLVAAMTHLAILVFSSLPVVMLCLPLGGVSFYEVLAAYVGLFSCLFTFGMISVACGGVFRRTAASLVVSYLLILPLVLAAISFWVALGSRGELRVQLTLALFPGLAMAVSIPLFYWTASRLLYPADLGSGGKEVVDLEQEAENAVGLVIRRDQFPDRLFAPPKRETLMEDGTNPIYDKEMRSEIFGQGTLMLRLAIQISMLLAIFLMAVLLYVVRPLAPWYVGYVVLFNLLVGPVFSAGSVTSERERQTLDLLLTTTLTPMQIFWGKLLSGLRVSSVLTAFLLWPLVLAVLMVRDYWSNWLTICAWILIVALTCLTTSNLALFNSSLFRKTGTSLVVTYASLVGLYLLPPAFRYFAEEFFPASRLQPIAWWLSAISPFVAAHEFPLYVEDFTGRLSLWPLPSGSEQKLFGWPLRDLAHYGAYLLGTVLLNAGLFVAMLWLFRSRWRVAAARE
ncbi:MAG: ABC transporter permease [Blastopirellula sp.]|nr:ABC transporter permease [Blastopirellula sp.]